MKKTPPTFLGKESGKPFLARDGAHIYELFRHSGIRIKHMSFATGTLKPGQTAFPHFHKKSEEVYFIIAGQGTVRVGTTQVRVKQGQAVYVPVGAIHALKNLSKTKPLKVLAVSSPSYSDDDMFFVE